MVRLGKQASPHFSFGGVAYESASSFVGVVRWEFLVVEALLQGENLFRSLGVIASQNVSRGK
jgi:hypothetical protein